MNMFDEVDDEFSDGDEPDDTQTSSDRIVSSFIEETIEEEDPDAYLFDVDQRLEVALCYRSILKGSFFDAPTASSTIVERELRGFVKGRLGLLLNAEKELAPAPSQFTADEVTALKTLAAHVLKRPESIVAKPTLTKVQNPSLPIAPTLVRKVASPEQPKAVAKVAPKEVYKAPAAKAAPPKVDRRRKRETKTIIDPRNNEPLEIDVTQQVVGSGRIPMPDMAATSMAQSMQAVSAMQGRNNSLVSGAVNQLKVSMIGD